MMEQINWSPGVTIEMVEKQVIQKAISFYRGNKTQCSIALGISIRTLDERLKKYEAEDKLRAEAIIAEGERRKVLLDRARGIIHTPQGAVIQGAFSGAQPMAAPEAPKVDTKVSQSHSSRRR
jgi:hypothetical protein